MNESMRQLSNIPTEEGEYRHSYYDEPGVWVHRGLSVGRLALDDVLRCAPIGSKITADCPPIFQVFPPGLWTALTQPAPSNIEAGEIMQSNLQRILEQPLPKITGYRDLQPKEVELINFVKDLEALGLRLIRESEVEDERWANSEENHEASRWRSIAKTHIQQGCMALVRAIAKPNTGSPHDDTGR